MFIGQTSWRLVTRVLGVGQPDEVARLPDDQAIIVMKGCAPVLGEKLGAEAPPVQAVGQQAKPLLKRVSMVAGALLISGSLGAWALWPTSTPAPAQSSSPSRESAHQAETIIAKHTPPATPHAEPELRGAWGLPASWTNPNAGKPWAIYTQESSRMGTAKPMTYSGLGGAVGGQPYGRFATMAECQTSLHQQAGQRISQLRQQAAVQRGFAVDVIEREYYISWRTTSGTGPHAHQRTIEALCYLMAEGE